MRITVNHMAVQGDMIPMLHLRLGHTVLGLERLLGDMAIIIKMDSMPMRIPVKVRVRGNIMITLRTRIKDKDKDSTMINRVTITLKTTAQVNKGDMIISKEDKGDITLIRHKLDNIVMMDRRCSMEEGRGIMMRMVGIPGIRGVLGRLHMKGRIRSM